MRYRRDTVIFIATRCGSSRFFFQHFSRLKLTRDARALAVECARSPSISDVDSDTKSSVMSAASGARCDPGASWQMSTLSSSGNVVPPTSCPERTSPLCTACRGCAIVAALKCVRNFRYLDVRRCPRRPISE